MKLQAQKHYRYLVALAASVAVLVIAIVRYVLIGESGLGRNQNTEKASTSGSSNRAPILNGKEPASNSVGDGHLATNTQSPQFDKEQLQKLSLSSKAVTEFCRKIEKKNTKALFSNIQFSSSDSLMSAFVISQPTVEQYGEMSNAISKELKNHSPDDPLQNEARERLTQILHVFTDYDDKFRGLYVFAHKDASVTVKSSDFPNEDAALPNSDGRVTYGKSVFVYSDDKRVPGGWPKRYGYLIQLQVPKIK